MNYGKHEIYSNTKQKGYQQKTQKQILKTI